MVSASSPQKLMGHRDIPGICGRHIKCMDTEQAVRHTAIAQWVALRRAINVSPSLTRIASVINPCIWTLRWHWRPFQRVFSSLCPIRCALLNTNVGIKQPVNPTPHERYIHPGTPSCQHPREKSSYPSSHIVVAPRKPHYVLPKKFILMPVRTWEGG